MSKKAKKKAWGILLVLSLIWGSSFILIKKGLLAFSALQVGGLRIFLTALILLPLALKYIYKVDSSKLLPIAVVGIVGSGAPAFLFAYAQTVINSTTAGMLNALTPLFTLLTGAIFFSSKMTFNNSMGVALGMGGAFCILSSQGAFSFHFTYGLLVIAATICYAVSTNVIKTYLQNTSPIGIVSIGFSFLLMPVGIYLYMAQTWQTLMTAPQAPFSFMSICILAVIGTGLALILYNRLIQLSTPVFASTITYLIPIVAILWGVFDQELLTIYHFMGIAGILAGIYLINLEKNILKTLQIALFTAEP